MSSSNTKIVSILIIEDNLADLRLIEEIIKNGQVNNYRSKSAFESVHAASVNHAIKILTDETFDIILLDLSLPDSQSLDTFYKVHQTSPETPIIILSGLNHEAVAVEAMKNGAQDYLLKRNIMTGGTLIRAIQYAIERHRLWRQLEEKKKQLEELESSRRQIIEHNADGILILDQNGVVKFVNPAAEDILRSDKSQLLDKPFHIPKLRQGTAELSVERRRGGEASIELKLVETEWNGEQVYQASVRDISDLKEIQNQFKEKANMLAVQNVELDEFAHTMAHQVQGLLSQMVGYASFIEAHYQKNLPDEAQYSLNQIVKSGNKMNNVINELLLLASMRSEVPLNPLDMTRITSEIMKRLRFQIKSSGADIQVTQNWPIPIGHAPWVEEALLNYITNGIKYGGEPPKIEIGATNLPNGFVEIWVKDNGAGISEMDQKRLFKPHTRLRRVRARGEGLGLSIVKKIIHYSGGKVGVHSEEGNGSKFWFTLPEAKMTDMNTDYEHSQQSKHIVPTS